MNSQSKTTAPSSAAPSTSNAKSVAKMLRILDEMEVGLKGVEPPIDSFGDAEDEAPAPRPE